MYFPLGGERSEEIILSARRGWRGGVRRSYLDGGTRAVCAGPSGRYQLVEARSAAPGLV